jgi:hypothetical protein
MLRAACIDLLPVEGSRLEGIALASDPDSFRIVMRDDVVQARQ